MRILQVAPVPPEVGGVDAGGIATHAWGLATHLAERGHEVAVLADNRPCPAEGSVVAGAERIAGVLVYGIRGYSIRRGPLSLANPRFLAQAHRAHTHLGEGWTWRHVLNVA